MLVYPFAADARWGNRNSSKFAWDAALACPVTLTAFLIWFVAVAPKIERQGRTIARTLASKRARGDHHGRAPRK